MEHADVASSDAAAGEVFERLVNFLNRLDDAHFFYVLGHTRPDSVMVTVAVPGWHWEVEFMADGSVEVERYESVAGVQNDPQLLGALFSDADPA
ncbi:MAG TPA: hypothetical protein VMA73_33295 [Streptosporangiaceae bacterium]|nr:hypothetical protein [Streptosporangiaceae bacterium]